MPTLVELSKVDSETDAFDESILSEAEVTNIYESILSKFIVYCI